VREKERKGGEKMGKKGVAEVIGASCRVIERSGLDKICPTWGGKPGI